MPLLNENAIRDLAKRGVINDTFRRLPADKKERVYRTALKLIGEYGYDGLSVDQLCTQAGISKGSFFQYFPSKSHLLEFTVVMFDDFLADWVRGIHDKESAVHVRDRLNYLFDSVFVNLRIYPIEQLFFRYITQAALHSAVSIEGISLERHITQYLRDVLSRGQVTGEIRRDIECDSLVEFIYAAFGGLIQRQSMSKKVVRTPSRDHLLTMFFDGIKA